MTTELEKSYLAGIIDGEGCIGAAAVADKRPGRSPSAMFTVFIAMTDREALDLAHRLYGGSVREKPDTRGGNRRMVYCWQAYGDIGARFLADILPYLRIKTAQAEAYIAARRTFTGGPQKGYQGARSASPDDLAQRFRYLRIIQTLNQRASHARC